jgi:hypothetical protein
MERGIVSSRVALLLRSAEIKPLFPRFVLLNISPPKSYVRYTGVCWVEGMDESEFIRCEITFCMLGLMDLMKSIKSFF